MNDQGALFFKPHKELEARTREAITAATESLKHCLGSRMHAVILTGSLARGEGIWKYDSRGEPEVWSDIDLLVITRGCGVRAAQVVEQLARPKKDQRFSFDLRLLPLSRARLLPKDTHTLDIHRTGNVLYGGTILSQIPSVNQRHLGMQSIEAIFFNRAFLNIKKVTPAVLESKQARDRALVCYEAARTLFTCTDIISIYQHRYTPFLRQRIEVAKQFPVECRGTESFISDLDDAFAFMFDNHPAQHNESVKEAWLRARGYLMALFTAVFKEHYNADDLTVYPSRTAHVSRSPLEQIRCLYKKLAASFLLLKRNGRMRIFWNIHPALTCRMACLMLYLATGSDDEGTYIEKALQYYSSVNPSYRLKRRPAAWEYLRNELVELHNAGIF